MPFTCTAQLLANYGHSILLFTFVFAISIYENIKNLSYSFLTVTPVIVLCNSSHAFITFNQKHLLSSPDQWSLFTERKHFFSISCKENARYFKDRHFLEYISSQQVTEGVN